jgi:energy-coupling factor transport system substrate-specific component
MSWQLASFLLLALALAGGFAWYERSHPSARVLALVGTLAALAVLGRIAFAPIPNVKPTTDVVLLAGYVFGGAPGFAVGAVAALASNLFFTQGPWTPWQMAAWGAIGVGGAALAKASGGRLGRVPLALACGLAGLLYGVIVNFGSVATFGGGDLGHRFLAYQATSLPWDLAHAAGNVAFFLLFGPALVRTLRRFRTRLSFTWEPSHAGRAVMLAAAASAWRRAAMRLGSRRAGQRSRWRRTGAIRSLSRTRLRGRAPTPPASRATAAPPASATSSARSWRSPPPAPRRAASHGRTSLRRSSGASAPTAPCSGRST